MDDYGTHTFDALDKKTTVSDGGTAVPFFPQAVSAEFSSGSPDSEERAMDLHRYIIKHPASTFFVRAQGDGMRDAHILAGDLLVVDRSLEVKNGRVVVACMNGEFLVRRFDRYGGRVVLSTQSRDTQSITVTPADEFFIWGVVTYIIHKTVGA